MKHNYEIPSADFTYFYTEDIITTSSVQSTPDGDAPVDYE